MRFAWLILPLFLSLPLRAAEANEQKVFRFHLLVEPQNLDPQSASAASGNYLFHNLYRGLYIYSREKGLRPEGAKNCFRTGRRLICQLKDSRWSDGSKITAADYVASFRRLIDPEFKSPQSDVLFSLKNAREIWAGKLRPDRLGVRAESELRLVFEFAESDPEFEYRLIHPALSPMPKGGFRNREQAVNMPTSGPYKIGEWKRGAWARLEPNTFYLGGNPKRPPAVAYFIDEDSTALRLFESGKLDFLRRLPVSEFARYRGKSEFKQFPMARFDYVGFGPSLKDQPLVRQALSKSLEFDDYVKIFGANSPAGCPSLPSQYLDKVNCLKPDFALAKTLADSFTRKDHSLPPKLEMQFSRMGGDDIQRAVEWMQGQWKKNLNWPVEIKSQEQAVYLSTLRESPPAIFRKGVSLDRPTCLAALEIFGKDHPENFIGLDDQRYEKWLDQLRQPLSTEKRKQICRQAVDYLLSLNRIIPLGEMHFTVLAKASFKGWELNDLNQLDLSQLTAL